ncbi:hypothetical protein RM572_16670 [Streptomyces sp. DSM 42041]|uniref:DUF3303 domain-containing protein n=1 Tax=Streptomyces hazeniae TaxID=3075538 RepID=A0ABU2NTT4_9ACTN|nr:hypothetical protein [Streptomyces sp. DSM 42041]MDT0380390.1 hypothetical protein [Streptomyces sp. DSM 42041]
MRMLLKARLRTEQGNRAIQSGEMEKTLLALLEDLKPEAAYFVPDEGKRCALIFFDMEDSWELPRITEPFFMEYDAEVSIQPAMNVEDAQRGLAALTGHG